MKVTCPFCGRRYLLRKDGTLRKHPSRVLYDPYPCTGSNENPGAVRFSWSWNG